MAVNGQQQGPFDVGALAAKAKDGSVTRETLVWKQGWGIGRRRGRWRSCLICLRVGAAAVAEVGVTV